MGKIGNKYVQRVAHEAFGGNGNMLVSKPGRTGKKRGGFRTREVNLTLAQSSMYTPEYAFSKHLKDALDKANRISPVRQYPERVGEVQNLSDPEAQLRSIAAIFVKKYRFVSHPISTYYAALRIRELTPDECHEIVHAVSRLGKEQKDQAMLAWLAVLERGGEDWRPRRRKAEEADEGEVPGEVDEPVEELEDELDGCL